MIRTKNPLIRSPRCIVLAALAVRIVYVVAHAHGSDLASGLHWEMGNLGYSLAVGRGFSSPFGGVTGPSAWTAPLYPWLISLALRTFGVNSSGAGLAMLVLNAAFSALTCWTVYRIAHRFSNETVAVWSGWGWALFPYDIHSSASWIWDTSLSALLLSLLFMLTLEMEGDGRLGPWFGYGLLWGIAGLTNTAMVAWLPFSGCWLAYQLHRRGKQFLVPVVLGALIFWATLMPWLVRNYSLFGKLILVRGDLGVELRAGNNPLADGGLIADYHPYSNGDLYSQYKQMGETAFVNQQGELARQWIVQHPQRFLVLTCRRFILFWFWAGAMKTRLEQVKNLLFLALALPAIGGFWLALRRRLHGVFLFVTLFGSYPLIYYFTGTMSRYRHTIDPELMVLAAFFVSSFFTKRPTPASAG